jgi:uncharacterized membrane protein YfcA
MTEAGQPHPLPRLSGGQLAGAAVVGMLAGFLSGLFGVGGGILVVPGLILFMRMSQRQAHGTSLAAIVPIAVSAVAGYALERSVDWAAAALIVVGAAAGAVLGTHVLQRIPERRLRLVFSLFLLITAGRLLVPIPPVSGPGELDLLMGTALVVVGIASGTVAGLLGVGGGIVIVPALVVLFSVPDAVAKGTSLAVIIPTGVVGTMRNIRHGNANLPLGMLVGLFGAASAFIGSKISVGLDPRVSSALYAGLLIVVAARMLVSLPGGPTGRNAGGRTAPGTAAPTEP